MLKRLPIFIGKAVNFSRKSPRLTFVVLVLLIGGLVWTLSTATTVPLPAPPSPNLKEMPGQGVKRAGLEKTLLDVETNNHALTKTVADLQRIIERKEQAQATKDEEAKRLATQKEEEAKRLAVGQEQRFEQMLKHVQAAATAKVTPTPAQKPAPSKGQAPQERPAVATGRQPVDCNNPAQVCVRIQRTEKPASFAGEVPSLARGDTPYLTEGSIAEARVVTGIMASAKTSRVGGIMLFTVTKPFRPPDQLQGPGRDPLPTEVPLQGCRVFAKTEPDLGSGRVIGQLFLLSCVLPDASSFAQPIHGYVTDMDNTSGLVGQLETHTSALVAKATVAGLLQEASSALGLAKSSLVVTTGGAFQTGQGAQTIINEIGHYYLDQARELGPTLWVPASRSARLVLLEGVALEGFPVRTLLTEREVAR